MRGWCVYVLRCADGSLYTGITNDLVHRLERHAAGEGARYTRSRLPVELVYRERARDRGSALRREAAIKTLRRDEKLALVTRRASTAPRGEVEMDLRDSTLAALERGRKLFNERRFWEAHEEWESAWLVECGDVRRALQGLIQVAAGCHHALVTGRAGGAEKLLRSGLEKLSVLPDELRALALERFRSQVALTLSAAQSWKRGDRDALDPDLLPRLETAGR